MYITVYKNHGRVKRFVYPFFSNIVHSFPLSFKNSQHSKTQCKKKLMTLDVTFLVSWSNQHVITLYHLRVENSSWTFLLCALIVSYQISFWFFLKILKSISTSFVFTLNPENRSSLKFMEKVNTFSQISTSFPTKIM
jgi:hypothetical protein